MSKKKKKNQLQPNTVDITQIDVMSPDKIKEAINLFNLTQAKKSAIRVDTYNNVMDLISNEVLDRFMNADMEQIQTGALLNVLQTISAVKEKETRNIQQVSEEPAIQLNQNINISVEKKEPLLPRDSKEKVIDAVKRFLAMSMQPENQIESTAELIEEKVWLAKFLPITIFWYRDIPKKQIAKANTIKIQIENNLVAFKFITSYSIIMY